MKCENRTCGSNVNGWCQFEAEGDERPSFCSSQSTGCVSGMKTGNGFDESTFVGTRHEPYATPMKKHNAADDSRKTTGE